LILLRFSVANWFGVLGRHLAKQATAPAGVHPRQMHPIQKHINQ